MLRIPFPTLGASILAALSLPSFAFAKADVTVDPALAELSTGMKSIAIGGMLMSTPLQGTGLGDSSLTRIFAVHLAGTRPEYRITSQDSLIQAFGREPLLAELALYRERGTIQKETLDSMRARLSPDVGYVIFGRVVETSTFHDKENFEEDPPDEGSVKFHTKLKKTKLDTTTWVSLECVVYGLSDGRPLAQGEIACAGHAVGIYGRDEIPWRRVDGDSVPGNEGFGHKFLRNLLAPHEGEEIVYPDSPFKDGYTCACNRWAKKLPKRKK